MPQSVSNERLERSKGVIMAINTNASNFVTTSKGSEKEAKGV